jgi:hypothetical protein
MHATNPIEEGISASSLVCLRTKYHNKIRTNKFKYQTIQKYDGCIWYTLRVAMSRALSPFRLVARETH